MRASDQFCVRLSNERKKKKGNKKMRRGQT